MSYKKNWNALDAYSVKAGATLPVLAAPCAKRIHGGIVKNVEAGERIPAGTPMYYDAENREVYLAKEGYEMPENPNSISIADCIGGSEATLIDVPYGVVYMYRNTIAPISQEVEKQIKDAGQVMLVWEYFGVSDLEK